MKVILDTNVLISGLLWSGVPSQILNLVEEDKIKLCFTLKTLSELESVLQYSKFIPFLQKMEVNVDKLINRLSERAIVSSKNLKIKVITEDPSDNKFLACALIVKASYIVSGDKHLLNLKKFQNIPILTPKQFLAKIK